MATISERMAKALAGARMAKNLYRDARSKFNAFIDAQPDEQWTDEQIREATDLRNAMEVAKRAWIASDEAIRSAKLYDRMQWLHGNGKEPSYV